MSLNSVIFCAVLVCAAVATAADATARRVSKAEYLDLMEAAVSAYSDEHVENYIRAAERTGVEEHGFPRLAANIGFLLAHGRMPERRETFRRMMDISCREAAQGRMRIEGNEFSVKELVIALLEVEKANLLDTATTGGWRAGLAAVEASRCYTCLPEVGAGRAFNWCVFGCASEQIRLAAGLGGDPAHVEKYVADQIRWLDANGMYRDPDQPAVYDFVTRLQFMTLLHFGYDGPSRAKLEALLDASAEPTLAMLSACGEIPYGGRSNQFLHNNTFYAAVCEWYAARARRRGDFRLAARFAGAARAAVEDLRAWLVLRPMRHVKNLYPRGSGQRGSGIGCEEYAYFDKYMVTMGSWAMMAYVLADDGDDTAAAEPGDAPLAFATTPAFHFVFLRAGDYSAQFDYAADRHYDCDGIGRIHRRGAPAAICLSTPCAHKPKYRTEHPNARSLAIAPVAKGRLEPVDSGHNSDAAWAKWRQGSAEWTCRLGAGGLSSVLTGAGPLALSLPAFSFDGQEHTEVSCDGRRLTVRYRGWACVYETDGEIVDTGIVCCNRNGRYRAFEARGEGELSVRIAINPAPPPMPRLLERRVGPSRLVHIERDVSAFQGWRAAAADDAGTAFGRPFSRGDEIVFDFGEHVVGYFSIELGDAGRPVDAPVRLDISFAEVPSELGEDRAACMERGTLSPSWIQDETVTIDCIPGVCEMPRRFAFRYVRVRVRACSNGSRVVLRGVSARAVTSADESVFRPLDGADALDLAIDRIAAATLRDSMQTCLEDGPKRDRRLWLGDLRLQALANYATYRNFDVVARSLFLLAECPFADGTPATAVFERPLPRNAGGRCILDYTALFPATVLEYLRASGDRAAAERLWPAAKSACRSIISSLDDTGLVAEENGFWNFIDWQDGFSRQAAEQGAVAYGLSRAWELACELGRQSEVAHLPTIVGRMRVRAVEVLWDAERGVWTSGRDRNVSWISQAYLALAGAGTPAMRRHALESVQTMPGAVRPRTPYAYHYFVEGLWSSGMKAEALALVRHYWGGMVKKGADTFWECFDPDDDFVSPYRSILLNSYCHAWSCTPSYWLRRAKEEGVR